MTIFFWKFQGLIIGVVLSYLASALTVSVYQARKPQMPFTTFYELVNLLIDRKVKLLVVAGSIYAQIVCPELNIVS